MTKDQFQQCVAQLMSINDAHSDIDSLNLRNEIAATISTMMIFVSISDIISILTCVKNRSYIHWHTANILNDYISKYKWEMNNVKK